MIIVESTVGVLIELRFVGSPLMADALEFEAQMSAIVRGIVKHQKGRAIVCTDLRACGVLAPSVSERILWLMRRDNPHVERNAFLGNDNAVLTLQVQRVINEAGADNRRRMFKREPLLVAWLDEICSVAERMRLRAFLAAAPAPGSG